MSNWNSEHVFGLLERGGHKISVNTPKKEELVNNSDLL